VPTSPAVRWPVPIGRHSCAPRFRAAHRQFAAFCGARRHRQPAHGAALSRRILYPGLWLDSGRSWRCSQGHPRRTPGQWRSKAGRAAEAAVRFLGEELDRIQQRSGRPAAGRQRRPLPFLVLPQAEAGGRRFDSSDTQRLSYVSTPAASTAEPDCRAAAAQYEPGLAKFSKRVYSPRKVRRVVPIGPLRCLPMMISATPFSGVSGLYTSSR
jgi:hypothetical protein